MKFPGILTGSLCAAALLAAGCTTSNFGAIDTTSTSALSPATADVSADDLARGKAQFRDGNYGLAEKHFRKAVELSATNREAWLGLAASYDQLGRFDFADRAYEQLVKLAGRQPRIVNNMGYSALLRGDRAKAAKLLAEARAGMPGDPVVEANLALLGKG
ncbi:MAG: tetratricopeptide repeat protein [Rhizobiaceae bacterium]|nr:tetratricopeptide repeat protein [Rhizobiaceae bacterium]MCV0408268.1 tetratricopeptide repeat protein [Rhizobiaceae bacterium]